MKFCKRCDCETDRKKSGACKPCAVRVQREWCAKNPEKKKASDAAYYSANLDKLKAYKAAYYLENRERLRKAQADWQRKNAVSVRAVVKAWRAANPDRAKANAKAWAAANKEKTRSSKAAWSAANPEVARVHQARRRAQKRDSIGRHTAADIKTLRTLQKNKCAACGVTLNGGYHVDHVMPLALGGGNGPDNLQLLCPPCNLEKSAKHPVDFMQQRGYLL